MSSSIPTHKKSPQQVVQEHLAKIPVQTKLEPADADDKISQIKQLLTRHNAVLVAHYYTDPLIQALAEETGGCVSDSLKWPVLAPITQLTRWWWRGLSYGRDGKDINPQQTGVNADFGGYLLLGYRLPH